jgi:hypothetical protein
MSSGQEKFYPLVTELIPLMDKIIQTNRLLEDIIISAENLDYKPKFYLICFYYLMLMEGSYKNVMKNLLAMKRTKEGKDVRITETLGLISDKELENDTNLKEILPEKLKDSIYRNLRNSIAHANFQYVIGEKQIRFWDINPRTQRFSLKPIKLTYHEFTKLLVELNLFCEIFGFIMLTLLAIEDIFKRYS